MRAQLGRVRLVGNEVGRNDTDNAIPEPVGSGRETDTAGTDGEREDLTNDDPGGGAPGGGERGNVQADESNHGAGGIWVGGVVRGVPSGGGTDDTDNELHDDHGSSTPDENRTATNLLDHDEREGSGEHVDERGDKRDQEGVLDGAELLEEDGTEVEDEVDTGQLLHHLHEDAENGTTDIGRRLGDLALEAGHPGSEVAGLGDDGHLVLMVGDDLGKLVLDVLRVDRLATDAGQGLCGLVELALLDEETGRLREQGQTPTENESPKELDGDGDSVGASVTAVLGRVDDAVGKQDTNGDAELVPSDDGTTNLAGSNLGHVPRVN